MENKLKIVIEALPEMSQAVEDLAASYKTAKFETAKFKESIPKPTDGNEEEIAEATGVYDSAVNSEAEAKQALDEARGELKKTRLYIKETKAAIRAEKSDAKKSSAEEKLAAKNSRVRQNDVLRPLPDSKCGQAWAIFDELSASTKEPAKLAEAVTAAELIGLNAGNVRAEYGIWRKFHGIAPQGRAKKEVPVVDETQDDESQEAAE